MSKVWVVSDAHWGHKNILKYRPEFSEIYDHDWVIMENILQSVNKRDTLWMLGDMFFDLDSLKFARSLRSHVKYIHFVLGNHDSDNNKRQEVLRSIIAEDLVDKIHGLAKVNGVWMSHAPIHPDELRGKPNIHGHVHKCTLDDKRYFNACVDVNEYGPVAFQEIRGGSLLYTLRGECTE